MSQQVDAAAFELADHIQSFQEGKSPRVDSGQIHRDPDMTYIRALSHQYSATVLLASPCNCVISVPSSAFHHQSTVIRVPRVAVQLLFRLLDGPSLLVE